MIFYNRYVSVDLEFSWGGLKKNPLTNKLCGSIIEIGAVKFNNGEKE